MQNPNQEAWEEFDAMVSDTAGRNRVLFEFAMLPDEIVNFIAHRTLSIVPVTDPQRWN